MDPKQSIQDWFDGERAVSPVIGVILMVAITVILAAVIGTFVLDLGQSAGQSAPQASLSVSVDSVAENTIEVEHTGGDAIDAANTKIIVEWNPTVTFTSASSSATLSVGGSITIDTDGTGSGAEITSGAFTGMSSSDDETFSEGTQITITFIDTQSQRQIFETTVTA